jgi:hypothetical protein
MQPMVSSTWDTRYERPAAWKRQSDYDDNAPRCLQCGVNHTDYDNEPGRLPEGHPHRYSSFCDTCSSINHAGPRHVHEEEGTERQIAAGTFAAGRTWTTAYQSRAIVRNGRIVGWQCTRCPAVTDR